MNAPIQTPTSSSAVTFRRMMQGVEPLDDLLAALRTKRSHSAGLSAAKLLVSLYRRVASGRGFDQRIRQGAAADMDALRGLSMKSRHPNPLGLRGDHYLGADDLATFERDGLLGPFDVMSPHEARRLADHAERWHDTEFEDTGVMTPEINTSLRTAGQQSINYTGMYQALRKRPLFDLVRAPEIAQRMASLLGNDVICWRSQFFAKKPGETGTFWHQGSVFRELAKARKLSPPPGVAPGMVQLTAWVALRDVTVANGALRCVPGSCRDGRIEYMYSHIQDHPLATLAAMPPKHAARVLETMLYTTGVFTRSHALFEAIIEQLGAILEGLEVRDLTMRAGQAIIFTSLNLHGSYPNTTSDQTRLAFAGRYTAADVGVFQESKTDRLGGPRGLMPYSLQRCLPIHVHGNPGRGVNHTMTEPYPEHTVLRPNPQESR